MLDVTVAAGFENVDEADQIALHIGARVLDRITHTGLRGQVHHPLRLERGEGVVHRSCIGQIGALVDVVRMFGEARQAGFLQRRVVIVVVVVDPINGIAARQQALREGGADEAGGAGDQNAHGRSSK